MKSLLDKVYLCHVLSHVLFLLPPLFQEPVLFSCSIRDNIAYGAVDPDAVSTEDVYTAARVANAYDFIQDFPKGFDTVVGEKGVLLSGEEQRQKHKMMITICQLFFFIL